MVASFSLRGRSIVTPDILKFNIVSGISMACPHVSGATRYIKSFQPKWSHIAILYALMSSVTFSSIYSCINRIKFEYS